MEENRLIVHLKKLKKDLAPMTWQQRLEHLWTYYKWVLAALAFAGFFIHVIISALITANTEILISGMSINTPITEAGVACLSDGYFDRLEGKRGQDVQFMEEILDPDNQAIGLEAVYSAVVKVSGLTGTNSLDYLILDEKALEYYSEGDLFMDLRQVFPEEELAQLNTLSIGEVPKLIDLTGTWFADTHITEGGPYYLAFAYTTTRTEQCHDLWLYLKSGE